jgi:GAF domain-containing protein
MPSSPDPAPFVRSPARLAALRALDLLDTPAEESFDRLASLAGRLLKTPVALVSLVDSDRQFFKSCLGLPEPWNSWRQTPLSHSFCQHVAATAEPLIVSDARLDPVMKENLAVRDLGVVAYLGVPLVSPQGQALGSFCVIDSVPRQWTPDDVYVVSELARSVMSEIELRQHRRQLEELVRQRTAELERTNRQLAIANAELIEANATLGAANNALRDEVARYRRPSNRHPG